ncbi:hypothetical protein PLCT1_01942 [Planctomycetaceae bacterium]|nr:hypothetical protein PLCT1_01942 [Planctomycetaceae bacterium]
MKLFKTSILAVLVLVGAAFSIGCGNAAEETVTKYLEAQKAADADAQVKLMREKDQAEAKEAVKAAIAADKEAGNELKSFEITSSESDSSNALIKVKVTRKKDGKEVSGEEQYVLDKENGEWRINRNMTEILLWATEYK